MLLPKPPWQVHTMIPSRTPSLVAKLPLEQIPLLLLGLPRLLAAFLQLFPLAPFLHLLLLSHRCPPLWPRPSRSRCVPRVGTLPPAHFFCQLRLCRRVAHVELFFELMVELCGGVEVPCVIREVVRAD